ncbi:F-box/FBD/LRR-repeat protein At5g56420-like [Coffea eugenioides]|uniref:F-box/FBD/LRR-repeat protein At5g56420-like n=1 Tax=Coffea eugenioides TaxID=49369 RepID=UPI000F61455E|nr:F-box/FBD/LRR-repeat protein At5g56420-like [Coffea eugenioides]
MEYRSSQISVYLKGLLSFMWTGAAIGIAITSCGLWGKVGFVVKKRRDYVLKVAYGDMQDDRISQLPDDILSMILSHLDLVEAIRTRILSRRWKNICKLRSSLDFDCNRMFGENGHHHNGRHSHKLRFLKAVYHSLQLYSSQNITRLSLTCCLGKKFAADFSRWIQSDALKGVRELMLSFHSCNCVDECGFPLPFQLLFEAASLTRLKLMSCVLQSSFRCHNNSLRFLTLVKVPLDNGEFPIILSSCLNLQGLVVSHCKVPPKLDICGQCLRLRSLYIEFCPGLEEIDICAGNLYLFSCYTDQIIRCSLQFVPKLEELSLSFNGNGTVPCVFGEVAKSCPRLKELLVQTKTDELLYMPAKMNTFSNLTMLALLMTFKVQADLQNVAHIIDACPLLDLLHLMARSPRYIEQRGGTWPCRHHSHLKGVAFDGFRGTRYEIEFASYVLQTAAALEKMCIYSKYRTFNEHFRWQDHVDYVMKDEGRRLIYKQLVGEALSSKVELIIE